MSMAYKTEGVNSKTYLGPDGFEKSIAGTGETALHAYFWPAEQKDQPKAIVLLLHGGNSYVEFDFLKFQAPGKRNLYEGSWVQELNRQGFAVCGFDFKGFGRSGGTRGLICSLDEHVDDFIKFVRDVLRTGGEHFPEGLPYFLMAHNLGGLVGVLGSLRKPGWLAGMVLLSPMLKLEQRITEIKDQGSLKFYNSCLPKKVLSVSEYDEPVRWLVEAWRSDKLAHDCSSVRARTAVELIHATERLAAADGPVSLCCVSVPFLVIQGARDTVLEPGGPQELMERAATNDKRLWSLPHRWHVLQKENGNEELLSDIIDWLDNHCLTSRTKCLFPKAAAAQAAATAAAAAAVGSVSFKASLAVDVCGSDTGSTTAGGKKTAVGVTDGPPGAVNAGVTETAPAPAGVLLPTASSRSLQPMTSGRFTASEAPSKPLSFSTREDQDPQKGFEEPDQDMVSRMARIALAAAEAEAQGMLTKLPSGRTGGLSPQQSVKGSVRFATAGDDCCGGGAGGLGKDAAAVGRDEAEEREALAALVPATPATGGGVRPGSPPATPANATTSATLARAASQGSARPRSGGGENGTLQGELAAAEDGAVAAALSPPVLLRGASGILSPRASLTPRWGSMKSQGEEVEPVVLSPTARPPSSLPPLGPNRFTPLPPLIYGAR